MKIRNKWWARKRITAISTRVCARSRERERSLVGRVLTVLELCDRKEHLVLG